jgi:hypothetical protein
LQAFESNASISNMAAGSSPTVPTDLLDLANVTPSDFTSGSIVNGNTVALYNGSSLVDHFTLASNVGAAAVHLTSDGHSGTAIFLATT